MPVTLFLLLTFVAPPFRQGKRSSVYERALRTGVGYPAARMSAASPRVLRIPTAIVYATSLAYLVAGLFWQTFRSLLPATIAIGIGAVLAIRVAALFASMSIAATLNWKAIWIGTAAGIVALGVWWPSAVVVSADPPRILLMPLLIASAVGAGAAPLLQSSPSSHFYHSSRFARFLHSVQLLILFFAALPASFFWMWTRPYLGAATLSAFALWQLWDGACPVTLTENSARMREGLPIMPPESGFVPDILARSGIIVSGDVVTVLLYALGFSVCGWFALTWWWS